MACGAAYGGDASEATFMPQGNAKLYVRINCYAIHGVTPNGVVCYVDTSTTHSLTASQNSFNTMINERLLFSLSCNIK